MGKLVCTPGIIKKSQDCVRSILDCVKLVGSKKATEKWMEVGWMNGWRWTNGQLIIFLAWNSFKLFRCMRKL